jgi:hypothetical protein
LYWCPSEDGLKRPKHIRDEGLKEEKSLLVTLDGSD